MQASGRLDVEARQVQQAGAAAVLEPFLAVRLEKRARPQPVAILVDPGPQPVPMSDQRLVADLDGPAPARLVGDDETRLAACEGFDDSPHGDVVRYGDPRAGVLAALARRDQADEQALGRR